MYTDQSHSCVSWSVWGLHIELERFLLPFPQLGEWGRRHEVKSRIVKELLALFLYHL